MKKKTILFALILLTIFSFAFVQLLGNYKLTHFANKKDNKQDILFVTYYLEQTGAQIMLLNLAQILLEDGYSVYIYAHEGGNMKKSFESIGVKVVVDNKYAYNHNFKKIAQQFDLIITSDLWASSFYLSAYKHVPTIWWVHAFPEYNETTINVFKNTYSPESDIFPLHECVLSIAKNIVSVSEMLADRIKMINNSDIHVIHNIIDEPNIIFEKKQTSDIVRFSTITSMGYRKGTDVLIDAIIGLPEQYKNKSEFYLVGDNSSVHDLKDKTLDYKNIKWTGVIPYKNIKQIYAQTDVIIHPSRGDTSGLVILEGALNNIPAIITENTGTNYIIKDGESGFIVPVGDAQALKEKIMWFIDNAEQIENMGKSANTYYNKTSQKNIFKAKWLNLIKKNISEETLAKQKHL